MSVLWNHWTDGQESLTRVITSMMSAIASVRASRQIGEMLLPYSFKNNFSDITLNKNFCMLSVLHWLGDAYEF